MCQDFWSNNGLAEQERPRKSTVGPPVICSATQLKRERRSRLTLFYWFKLSYGAGHSLSSDKTSTSGFSWAFQIDQNVRCLHIGNNRWSQAFVTQQPSTDMGITWSFSRRGPHSRRVGRRCLSELKKALFVHFHHKKKVVVALWDSGFHSRPATCATSQGNTLVADCGVDHKSQAQTSGASCPFTFQPSWNNGRNRNRMSSDPHWKKTREQLQVLYTPFRKVVQEPLTSATSQACSQRRRTCSAHRIEFPAGERSFETSRWLPVKAHQLRFRARYGVKAPSQKCFNNNKNLFWRPSHFDNPSVQRWNPLNFAPSQNLCQKFWSRTNAVKIWCAPLQRVPLCPSLSFQNAAEICEPTFDGRQQLACSNFSVRFCGPILMIFGSTPTAQANVNNAQHCRES